MVAANDPCLKGATLLAKAGVSIADAQWLFAAKRAGGGPQDQVRLNDIRRKVEAFLATVPATARARRAA
jgi:hypothetical protein